MFLHNGQATPSDALSLARAVSQSPAYSSPLGYYTLAGTLLDHIRRLRGLLIVDDMCSQGDLTRYIVQVHLHISR